MQPSSGHNQQHQYFYPRPPRGGRHLDGKADNIKYQFLSTPSARRATKLVWFLMDGSIISIHALREEGDQGQLPYHPYQCTISIHALREEGDVSCSTAPRFI